MMVGVWVPWCHFIYDVGWLLRVSCGARNIAPGKVAIVQCGEFSFEIPDDFELV